MSLHCGGKSLGVTKLSSCAFSLTENRPGRCFDRDGTGLSWLDVEGAGPQVCGVYAHFLCHRFRVEGRELVSVALTRQDGSSPCRILNKILARFGAYLPRVVGDLSDTACLK